LLRRFADGRRRELLLKSCKCQWVNEGEGGKEKRRGAMKRGGRQVGGNKLHPTNKRNNNS